MKWSDSQLGSKCKANLKTEWRAREKVKERRKPRGWRREWRKRRKRVWRRECVRLCCREGWMKRWIWHRLEEETEREKRRKSEWERERGDERSREMSLPSFGLQIVLFVWVPMPSFLHFHSRLSPPLLPCLLQRDPMNPTTVDHRCSLLPLRHYLHLLLLFHPLWLPHFLLTFLQISSFSVRFPLSAWHTQPLHFPHHLKSN